MYVRKPYGNNLLLHNGWGYLQVCNASTLNSHANLKRTELHASSKLKMVVCLTFAPLPQDYCKKNATFPIRPGKMEMLNQGPTVAPLQYGGPHAAGGYWGNPGTAMGAPRTVGGMPGSVGGMPGSVAGMPGTIGGMPVSIAGMPGTVGGMPVSIAGMPGTAPSALSSIYVNMEEGSQVTALG
jgi:hypothetical protein